MKRSNLFILVAQILTVFLLSCSDEKDNPKPDITDDTGPKGSLRLHLHTYANDEEVEAYSVIYNRPTEDHPGRKISFSLAQFYLSNFQLVKLDGSTVDVKDAKIIKVQDEETYEIGNVPVGNYKSINFYVGLNPTDNKKAPGTESSDILNKSEMWFGSTAQPDGYVFLTVEGKIDTTAAANSDDDKLMAFRYKIGTDANYKKVEMPTQNFAIVPGVTPTYIHMYADCLKLFNGIQLSNKDNFSVLTVADNNSALAKKITDNIPSIFKYEN